MTPTLHDFDVALSQSEAIIKGSIFGDISKLDIHTNEKDYLKNLNEGFRLNGEFVLKKK